MTRRALLAVAGFLGLCLSLSAQETQQPGPIRPVFVTLSQPGLGGVADPRVAFGQSDVFNTRNSAYYGFPSLTLSDRQLFSLTGGYGWIEAAPPDLPVLSPNVTPKAHQVAMSSDSGKDSTDKVVAMPSRLFDYAGGEVGVLFGKSTGKYGGDLEQGYIFGEVGNDKFHISAGASYQEFSGHVPRWGH